MINLYFRFLPSLCAPVEMTEGVFVFSGSDFSRSKCWNRLKSVLLHNQAMQFISND